MLAIDDVVATADRVFGYMDPPELRWLAETAQALPSGSVWCEIGSWQGRSATAVAGGLQPGCRLVLVDNFSGPTTREMPNKVACQKRLQAAIAQMRAWKPGIAIELRVGDSEAVARTMPPASFAVVFIDGDHSYAKVAADITSWRPTLQPGGLFCGHDFTHKCGVEPAVRELLPHFGQVEGTSLWYARC
ncbi:MAG TPA: class I SAM-dependent methyltransferase [Vicinamibacterales bacterium]|nr:class I SAM-dependent methyltransferase [Vicinamibacterales bacterium]